ncbi:MAG: PAS domain-containing protein [Chloroflexota bacterium]
MRRPDQLAVTITSSQRPAVITIPSSDAAFRHHVRSLVAAGSTSAPGELEDRLRRLFPRVVVRERALSGESPSWYVYRDGGWRASDSGPWWQNAAIPRVAVSSDGWLLEANTTACSLLGIPASEVGSRHFTDFVAPGTLEDAQSLFGIVDEGHELNATVLLRPTSGDVIAIDIHAARVGALIEGMFRLAEDIVLPRSQPLPDPPTLVCRPDGDVAFSGYARQALARMPEPTTEMLELRLRRLYPHAQVVAEDGRWTVLRDGAGASDVTEGWWRDPSLPLVRYDAQALILEANDAAKQLLGSVLVGHHWQEFVTPGSTEQVSEMLEILARVGAAESRFRMPGADGSLVEFDSYTSVEGEAFTTVMRPRA